MSACVCVHKHMAVTVFPWNVDSGYGIIYEKVITNIAVPDAALTYLPSGSR